MNLWGFVSVMLALLFVLIGDLTPDVHQRGSVDLPTVQNAVREPKALREDAMRVAITRDGQVYFRQTRVIPADLPNLMRTALREGAEKKVYLAADSRAKYGNVEVVLDQIRLASITNVAILVENFSR